MKNKILDDLFLTKKEECFLKLNNLADKFILEPKEMLFQMNIQIIETKDVLNELVMGFKHYKRFVKDE